MSSRWRKCKNDPDSIFDICGKFTLPSAGKLISETVKKKPI